MPTAPVARSARPAPAGPPGGEGRGWQAPAQQADTAYRATAHRRARGRPKRHGHFLTHDALAAGRRAKGRYIALCGVEVLPAALVDPERGVCTSCAGSPEQQHPAEHARRLYTRSTRVEDGLPCVLLVVEGDDSWSITGQGQDLPAYGVRVPNDVMYLLANRIVALSNRQVGDPGD